MEQAVTEPLIGGHHTPPPAPQDRVIPPHLLRVSLYVDDVQEGGVTLSGGMFQLADTQPIYLGLLPEELGIRGDGYTGCISDLVVQDKLVWN